MVTTGSIATAEQYATWARAHGVNDAPGDLLAALTDATSRLRSFCRRDFLPSPAAPTEVTSIAVIGDGGYTLFIPDCMYVQSVAWGGVEFTRYKAEGMSSLRPLPLVKLVVQQYAPLQSQVIAMVLDQSRWVDGVRYTITGRFGYAEIGAFPGNLVRACCMLAFVDTLSLAAVEATRETKSFEAGTVKQVFVTSADRSSTADAMEAKALKLARDYRR